jgi:hypothetical protein
MFSVVYNMLKNFFGVKMVLRFAPREDRVCKPLWKTEHKLISA